MLKKQNVGLLIGKLIIVVFFFHIGITPIVAQAPNAFSYQAVVRDAQSNVTRNTKVNVTLSILQGSPAGSEVYSEFHNTTTNTNGLLTLEIGNGNPLNSSLSLIDWASGPFFIKTEMIIEGGNGNAIVGTSQLMSVPYALYAANSPAGLDGNNGSDGDSAYQIWLDAGNAGTLADFLTALKGMDGVNGVDGADGTNGTNGLDGDSAYQIWLDAGNAGTQADFLTALNGVDGVDGSDGLAGTSGTDGKTVLNGTVDPTSEGVEGDFFLNTAASMLFGPKSANAWGNGTSLIGPAGPLVAGATNQTLRYDGANWVASSTILNNGYSAIVSENLKVQGLSNNRATLALTGTSSNWQLGTDIHNNGGNDFYLEQGGCCTRLFMSNNGELAIGANFSNPTALLDVDGTFHSAGNATIDGDVAGASFKKTGGTSSEFLKADGSVDTNSYTSQTYVDTEIAKVAFELGEIKQTIGSLPTGWVKLEGQAISSLSANQQTNASSLGLTGNLPDATNAYLSQNGTTLGSISGSNSKTIAQHNLPNVTLSGTTSTDGAHTHSIQRKSHPDIGAYDAGDGNAATNSAITSDRAVLGTFNVDSNGNHNHTLATSSINGGVLQQNLDITPNTLSVNTYIYLGE